MNKRIDDKLKFVEKSEQMLVELLEKIEKYELFIQKKKSNEEALSTSEGGKLLYQLQEMLNKLHSIPERIQQLANSSSKELEELLSQKSIFTEEELKIFDKMEKMVKEAGFPPVKESESKKSKRKNRKPPPGNNGKWLQVD
ncbi:MAG: hypothetical protein GWP59_08240 [Chlamydiales bacterium]|nr:hypothetical protein [Chlamydiales bacterium]NCF71674.1 hypothetical protein [Chlamydiales bacterium]